MSMPLSELNYERIFAVQICFEIRSKESVNIDYKVKSFSKLVIEFLFWTSDSKISV
jgi:hypothetical protein